MKIKFSHVGGEGGEPLEQMEEGRIGLLHCQKLKKENIRREQTTGWKWKQETPNQLKYNYAKASSATDLGWHES